MGLKNMKVWAKIFMASAIIMAFFWTSTVLSFYGISQLTGLVEFYFDGPNAMSINLDDMDRTYERMQKYVFRAISAEDEATTTASVNLAEAAAEEYLAYFEEVKAVTARFVADFPELREPTDTLQANINKLTPLRQHVIALLREGNHQEAFAYMEDYVSPVIQEVSTNIKDFSDLADQQIALSLIEFESTTKTTIYRSIAMVVASTIMMITGCIYLTTRFTKPIDELKKAAEEMANGNMNAKITYQSKDEMGQLADSMRTMMKNLSSYVDNIDQVLGEISTGNLTVSADMEFLGDFAQIRSSMNMIVDSLSETMGQITQASEQVASGSEQVASGAQALSQGATEQASSVEELAATINEISAQVRSNAENAAEANKLVREAAAEVENCNDQMEKLAVAITEMNDRASQVDKIIRTIEDIAFQTNILALNAAVEAARAGSAGKGFAVVADEVRNLASKSAEAAKNTTGLISDVLSSIEYGTQMMGGTRQSLKDVVERSKGMSSSVERISEASNEQANAVNQITQGIDQISSVVQTNSATAEESAAASQQLSSQSSMLKELVGRFVLGGGSTSFGTSYMPAMPQYSPPVLEAGSDLDYSDEYALSGNSKYEI